MNAVGHRSLPVEDKRELLLDAAERVFCRNGYAGTTMAALAAEAGVTRPTVYAYFASKDEVFAALAARVRRELLELQEHADVSTPDDTIVSTLTAFLDAYTRHRGMLTVIAHQALDDPSMRLLQNDIGAQANRRHTRFIARLAESGAAHPAIAPALIAETITGIVVRFAELAATDPTRRPELNAALIDAYRRLVGLPDRR